MRFDPVWRRIKPDSFATQLEGQFSGRLDRLDGLNNWGSLGWLYSHATASKLAHHFGLEWNAIKFLDGDEVREKYRASFRTAAHVAHWGHLPLSYAGEEAVLRAADVDSRARAAVDKVIDDVIAFGSLRCDVNGHDCAASVRSGDHPFYLYRWLSAWLVKRQWKSIWKAIRAACEDAPDEAGAKKNVIETLVCTESRGFKILRRCNQADYVPRDLLQAGTAWLTFDIEALWEGNPLGSDAAREWSLIDAAQSYLDKRFFHSPDALLVHSLAARAIAGGLLADGVTQTLLADLTMAADDYFIRNLKQYHRERLARLQAQVGRRISDRWKLVGSFADVSLDEGSRLQMETQLSGVTGRNRISYPFTMGVSIVVEPAPSDPSPVFDVAGPGRQLATVHLHHEDSPGAAAGKPAARPMLNVVAKIADRIAPGPQLGNNLMSWILGARVEQRSAPVERLCGEIAVEEAGSVSRAVAGMRALKTGEEVRKHRMIDGLLFLMADPDLPAAQWERWAGRLVRMPWVFLRYSPGQRALRVFEDAALAKAVGGPAGQQGYALELAVAANQLLVSPLPSYRLVFLGATLIGKDGQPAQEWDVVRLDLDAPGGWSVTAVECAVKRSGAKDDAARDKLELLQTQLAGRFDDLATYQTLFATHTADAIQYEDAGRSWTKV